MHLGCSTILYGGYPLDVALEGIRDAGYAAIELGAIPGMADHLSADGAPGFYRGVRAAVADRGLAIESIGASTNLLDPERRARFIRLMEAAATLGAPAITTGSGGVSDDESSFRAVVDALAELARIGADLGVRVSIKPHVRAAVYSTPTALRFVEEITQRSGWRGIGLNFDASHLWRANEAPEDSLRQLAPYLATARMRDAVSREPDGPGPVEQQVPGNGALDLRAIADQLAAIPGLTTTVLEIVGTKDQPLPAIQHVVRASRERLADLFA